MPELTNSFAMLLVAAVSGGIAIVGYIFTRISAKDAIEQKQKEIELLIKQKQDETELLLKKHRALLESLRQEQLAFALQKRAETYPKLYAIISDYGRSWTIRGKQRDLRWVEEFLEALLDNNSQYGVFFSVSVYKEYGKLRNCLTDIRDDLQSGKEMSNDEIEVQIYNIIMGENGGPGLGTWLKDDLGSYIPSVVTNVHPEFESWKHTTS